MPTVVTLRTRRREIQAAERSAAAHGRTHTYEGEEINLVFTTPSGGLVLRQTSAKLVKRAGQRTGIDDDADLGTHAGRRKVVTTLFVDGDEAIGDMARFVGHAEPATTAGYVKRLGRRPKAVAKRAAAVLDSPPGGDREAGQSHGHTESKVQEASEATDCFATNTEAAIPAAAPAGAEPAGRHAEAGRQGGPPLPVERGQLGAKPKPRPPASTPIEPGGGRVA